MTRIFAFVVVLLITTTAQASFDVTIQTDSPVGSMPPLTINPGTTSGPMTVSIFSGGDPPDLPKDQLTGWQTSLEIVPVGGATGTVTFNSATMPTSNYIFTAAANPGINTNNMGNTLLAFSSNGNFEAVTVPTTPTNLLRLDFNASNDAVGTFHVIALDGPFQTEWNDNASINAVRMFANLPGTGAGVAIGEITVVPEPSAFLFMMIPLGVVVAVKRFRQLSKS